MSRQVKVIVEDSLADFRELEVIDLDYRGIQAAIWCHSDTSITVRIEDPLGKTEKVLMLHRSREAMREVLTLLLKQIDEVKPREEIDHIQWTAVNQADDKKPQLGGGALDRASPSFLMQRSSGVARVDGVT